MKRLKRRNGVRGETSLLAGESTSRSHQNRSEALTCAWIRNHERLVGLEILHHGAWLLSIGTNPRALPAVATAITAAAAVSARNARLQSFTSATCDLRVLCALAPFPEILKGFRETNRTERKKEREKKRMAILLKG